MQTTISKATLLKKASYIMPFGYISIVFASICDIIIFHLSFDWVSIVGMVMTSFGLLSKLLVAEE
jgi:drug/metabolite transporter (DMT)-like permease